MNAPSCRGRFYLSRWLLIGLLLAWHEPAYSAVNQEVHYLFPASSQVEKADPPGYAHYDIIHDSLGRLWTATDRGVFRYSGFDWEPARSKVCLPKSRFTRFFRDQQGGIWLAGHAKDGFFLGRHHQGGWQAYAPPQAVRFRYGSNSSHTPSATRLQRFSFYAEHKGNGGYRIWLSNQKALYCWTRETGWLQQPIEGLSSNIVQIMVHAGRPWVLTRRSLYRGFRHQDKLRFSAVAKAELSSGASWNGMWAQPGASSLWLLNRQHVRRMDFEGAEASRTQCFEAPASFFEAYDAEAYTRMQRLDSNRLLVCSGSIPAWFDLETHRWQRLDLDVPIHFSHATSLSVDPQGLLWVGTMRGVYKVPDFRLQRLDFPHRSREKGEVSALLALPDNQGMVVGTNSQLMRFEEDSLCWRIRLEDVLPTQAFGRHRVLDLCRGRGDTLYAALTFAGVYAFRASNGEVLGCLFSQDLYENPGRHSFFSSCAFLDGTVYASSKKYLWMQRGGAYRKLVVHKTAAHVRKLLVHGDHLILATATGLYTYTPGDTVVRRKGHASYYNQNDTYHFTRYRNGELAATRSGVQQVVDGRLVAFPIPGVPEEMPVYALARDSSGWLWLGANQGVYRWRLGDRAEHFHVGNGLSGNEINRGAFEVDEQGRLWIGTDQGLSLFDERQQPQRRPATPHTMVDRLIVDRRDTFLSQEPITLPAGNHYLEFILSGKSSRDPQKLRYQMRLDGLHTEWVDVDSEALQQLAFYLDPGFYQLHLRGWDESSGWGPATRSAQIRIDRPFYQQAWFMGLMSMSLVGLGLGGSALQRSLTRQTQLKKALHVQKEAQHLSHSQLRTIWQHATSGLMVVHGDGRVIETNPAMEALLQKAQAARQPEYIQTLIGEETWSHLQASSDTRQVTGAADARQLSFLRELRLSAGCFVQVGLASLPAHQGSPRFLALWHDITEQVQALDTEKQARQAAEQANRLKSSFLSTLSHEVRTPINGIVGIAEIIGLDHGDDPSLQQYSSLIQESSQRLLSTLDSILHLAKLESEDMPVRRKPTDLGHLVNRLVQAYQPLARQKGLDLQLEHTSLEHIELHTDPQLVEQVITNLMANAMKYTHEGRIEVRVYEDNPRRSVCMAVSDTGIGIQPSFIPKLFDAFSQESSGAARRYEGVGLGLHLSHRMVRMLGGDIEVDSTPGVGSTFTVVLPLTYPPGDSTQSAHKPATSN